MRLLYICVLHYAAFILAGQLDTLATGIAPEVLGECVAHSHCAATEFCSVSVCSGHDVDAPCGVCRSCQECVCDSMAVDAFCPDSCGARRFAERCPLPCKSFRVLAGMHSTHSRYVVDFSQPLGAGARGCFLPAGRSVHRNVDL